MKKISLKIVANNCPWPSWPAKLEELRQWAENASLHKGPVQIALNIDLVHTNFQDIPFTDYFTGSDGKGKPGVDPAWYDKNILPLASGCDIIMFQVPLPQWKPTSVRGWRTDKVNGSIETQVGADEDDGFILGGKDGWVGTADDMEVRWFLAVAHHELSHSFYMMTGQTDRTHEFWERGDFYLDSIFSDLSFSQSPKESMENISDLQKKLAWATKTLQDMLQGILSMQKPVSMVEKLIDAIQRKEGYAAPGVLKAYPNGTPAWRNRNPGNLKWVDGMSLASGQDPQGFAIFPSYEAGREQLRRMLVRIDQGKSSNFSPDMTLYQFFAKYAPSSDKNNPTQYAKDVALWMGVSPLARIGELV